MLQVNKVVVEFGRNSSILFEVLAPLVCLLISLAKYFNGIFQMQKFRQIIARIQRDNERLLNSPEHGVLNKYMMEGRVFVQKLTIYIGTSILVFLTSVTIGLIYNETHPVNGTVVKEFMFQVDYNVDPEKYFFLITLHCYILTVVGMGTVVAFDTAYIMLTQHACALFAVAGFRLKTAHILYTGAREKEENLEKYEFTSEEEKRVYDRLVLGIKEHQNALQYVELFQSLFSVSLFIQLCLNIVSLSVSGVLTIMKLNNFHECLRIAIWAVGQWIHLFWLCLPGQNLTNSSEQLHYDTVECMWYLMCKRTDVDYKFLLMNTMKSCKLVAFKVTTLNMETYLAITKSAMSYFTVLSSTL